MPISTKVAAETVNRADSLNCFDMAKVLLPGQLMKSSIAPGLVQGYYAKRGGSFDEEEEARNISKVNQFFFAKTAENFVRVVFLSIQLECDLGELTKVSINPESILRIDCFNSGIVASSTSWQNNCIACMCLNFSIKKVHEK